MTSSPSPPSSRSAPEPPERASGPAPVAMTSFPDPAEHFGRVVVLAGQGRPVEAVLEIAQFEPQVRQGRRRQRAIGDGADARAARPRHQGRRRVADLQIDGSRRSILFGPATVTSFRSPGAAAKCRVVLFGAIFFTRWLPALVLAGLAVLAGAAAVLTAVATGSEALVVIGAGAVGVGVGASVAPALFTTGFTLPSRSCRASSP